jgi:Zn-dependent protease
LPAIDFVQVLYGFLILLFSLTVHEAAHAWSADRLGDVTARSLGRVSLNPAVHVDPIGTILFPLIALATNVPLIGWAKPVPVDTRRLGPHWKRKFMLIAAAGPASNLVLAIVAAVTVRTLSASGESGALGGTLQPLLLGAVQLNVLLAVFNMLPVPPLDGGNVLAGVLSGAAADAFDRLRPYGFLIIYALLLTGTLWAIVSPVEQWVYSVLF